MYNNRFKPNRRGPQRGFLRGNLASRGGASSRGVRRIKTFDPSQVINNLPQNVTSVTQEEYVPTHAFADFNIDERLKANILKHGYKTPTPVQDKAIPAILEGRDLIGIANTGTGKTAAFLIPLVNKMLADRNFRVLIMAPTRELASQIKDELFVFADGLGIYAALLIGGASMGRQIDSLRRNPNFVIGTPGRVTDLIKNRYLDLSRFSAVVLDEADHMVDIGFIHDIKYMISLLPTKRLSLFFSATIDEAVRGILQSFVHNPVTVSVKTGDTAANVEQKTIRVGDPAKKIEQLHQLLIQKEFEKVLIFGRTKHGVQRLSDDLVKRGFRSDAIHGNKNQSQRIKTLASFKQNNIQILIATDVASRGLDIPNVSHVINYDLPESYEAYIHRIGRTGRADKKGIALTFVG
ncbi:MAG: DEAD/DEAH box helicase [Candidatus Woesebacteria bacterium]|nr:MAG: DEAD/DEAH box helicase [Candidatus Woesebacteria bacterium]